MEQPRVPETTARALVGALMMVALAGAPGGRARGAGPDDLVIAPGGPPPVIVTAPEVGPAEQAAAADLAKYIDLLCGVRPDTIQVGAEGADGLRARPSQVLLVVGQAALDMDASLQQSLERVARPDPVLRADAIALRRRGNLVLLAGNNDASHYYAVSRLLQRWGCRWYMPTAFGECIPERQALRIGALDERYAPPFEVRKYWISWNGDGDGAAAFRLRNFMNDVVVPSGHTLAKYVADIVPPGGSSWNIPIADPKTAAHVAGQVMEGFARGDYFSMGMEDGTYTSADPRDDELKANLRDKYFQTHVLSDPFLVFYNNLCAILLEAHPDSTARIGFLAYANLTIPPQRAIVAARPLVAYLAPIDVDPIHGMDDPRSPPRREYLQIMRRWAEVMEGRVVIYDYDQGMLVWRDVPNPSHMAFRQDVRHYRDAGILGVDTESRNAIGTIFTNLFFRAQLLWDPDVDVDVLLDEFFPAFYGRAADPMRSYWGAIYRAWEETIVQEHEHFVAPAIYTPPLVEALRVHLGEAEALVKPLQDAAPQRLSRNEKLLLARMRFTRLSFDIIDNYMKMVRLAAGEVDYKAAVAAGEAGLATRERMTAMSGIFTTYRLPGQPGTKIMESGPAWFSGETQQYAALAEYTDGPRGRLLTRLPLTWAFRRDPHDTGLASHFAGWEADLTFWHANRQRYATPASRKDYPTTRWEMVRTDLYPQAQGVLHPDWQAFTGFLWYKSPIELQPGQVDGNVHLRLPGLFSEAWLYVNGYLVSHRPQKHVWWYNDYGFEWNVDVSGCLRAGTNDITLRVHCTHHMGGMFRRPFLYRALAP